VKRLVDIEVNFRALKERKNISAAPSTVPDVSRLATFSQPLRGEKQFLIKYLAFSSSPLLVSQND